MGEGFDGDPGDTLIMPENHFSIIRIFDLGFLINIPGASSPGPLIFSHGGHIAEKAQQGLSPEPHLSQTRQANKATSGKLCITDGRDFLVYYKNTLFKGKIFTNGFY